jgi:membrane associated rhomboid family serine protease
MNNYQYYTFRSSFLTKGVKQLLIITGAVFLLQVMMNPSTNFQFTYFFSLSINGIKQFRLWQPVTYMFFHAGFFHILLNMLALFFFGPEIERLIGRRHFFALYLGCGILAGLGWLLMSLNTQANCIGASGAVFGILATFAVIFPKRPVTLLLFFIFPITLRARTLALGLAAFNFFAMMTSKGNIAYAAHLVGFIAGYCYGYFYIHRNFSVSFLNPFYWLNQGKWHWQRRKFKVIKPEDKYKQNTTSSSSKVNEILDKVSKYGMSSLSNEEREILNKASMSH